MKKVLIISYFFPPANFVGAERTDAWAKYLHEFGYYPIIITRNWNENQTDLTNKVINNEYSIEKTDKYEIRRLPYKYSLRDKLAENKRFRFLQKALTFKELIFSNFFISALPYANFYEEARKVLSNQKDITKVIASARPFQLFHIGYQLKKDYPNIHWIPDYRDEWSTHAALQSLTGVKGLIQKIEKRSELKWLSNATFFITTSGLCRNSISKLIRKKGHIIWNGYNEVIYRDKNRKKSKELIITYAGTLYPYQNTQVFIDACLKILSLGYHLKVRFIGANVVEEKLKEIQDKTRGFSNNFEFINRVSKERLKEYYAESDLLFLTEYTGFKGWLPVKIFDYFSSDIPMLLCPSDNGVLEEFIQKSNSGFIANTVEECEKLLIEFIKSKERGESISLERNMEYGKQFSRKYQTKKLAELLESI